MGKIISVGGTSRSGSTMLHLILGNAPNAFACGEVLNWFRPAKMHHFNQDCACGQNPCPVWERLDDASAASFYGVVLQKLRVDFVVDSSKEISWLLDARGWASAQGIEMINIFVWKDPVDLAYSFWKRGRGILFWRSEFVKYYKRILQIGLPLLAVNFNELTRAPEAKVAEVCAAIGMLYYPGKERFWENEQHHLFGSFGVRRQVEAGESTILKKRQYPPQFAEQVSELRKQIAADKEVQHLLAILRQADVAHVSQQGQTVQSFAVRRLYPAWYYAQRGKRLLHRYFPRDIDFTKKEEVATIPRR